MTRKSLIRGTSLIVMLVGLFAFPAPSLADEGGCTAGGFGSTSCTITVGPMSCSVTCAAGFYACCGAGGCGCVQNAPQ